MIRKVEGKKKYLAAILDFDGTVMDSVPLVSRAWQHAARKSFGGSEIPLKAIMRELHGHPKDAYGRLGKSHPEAFQPEKLGFFLEEKEKWMDENRHLGKVFSGVVPFLKKCKAEGIKTALVTSAREEWIRAYPSFATIEGYFDFFVFSDTLKEQKPDPTPFLFAARNLGVSPPSCISIGDGISDVVASKKAGMDFFAVTTGTVGEAELKLAGADRVFPSIARLSKSVFPVKGKSPRTCKAF